MEDNFDAHDKYHDSRNSRLRVSINSYHCAPSKQEASIQEYHCWRIVSRISIAEGNTTNLSGYESPPSTRVVVVVSDGSAPGKCPVSSENSIESASHMPRHLERMLGQAANGLVLSWCKRQWSGHVIVGGSGDGVALWSGRNGLPIFRAGRIFRTFSVPGISQLLWEKKGGLCQLVLETRLKPNI